MTRLSTALRSLACIAIVLLLSQLAGAQDKPLSRLFPKRAKITFAPTPGLTELRLPEHVQRAIKPDLSDVRLLDPAGQEVPYVVDSALQPWRPRVDHRISQRAPIKRLRRKRWSPDYHEEFTLKAPRAHTNVSAWTLHLDSNRSHFVARVRLVDDDNPNRQLAEGSFYRLRRPLREGQTIKLPRDLPPRIRMIIDGQDGYLEPTARYVGRRPYELVRVPVPLRQQQQSQTRGATTLVLERPPGVVPLALQINTSTGTYHRQVSITDSGPGGGAAKLGSGYVYRAADFEGVVATQIDLSKPHSNNITVLIDNGDSPALKDIEVLALVEPPTLLFDSNREVSLYYGGGRAHRPRYDVQALVDKRDFRARDSWNTAELSASEDNPSFDPSPALQFLLRPGAPVEKKDFRQLRALKVSGASEGLSKLQLAAVDIAASLNELGDIRVVDGQGRQWPFLLDRQQVNLLLPTRVAEPVARQDGSHYGIALPAQPLSVSQLELHCDTEMASRSYKLFGYRGDERLLGASGTLTRTPGSQQQLVVPLPGDAYDRLELVVQDGGDAPLRFSGASLTVPSAELYLAAPDGAYTMLLGNADLDPPAYDMDHTRKLVLALPAATIEAAALSPNPDHRPTKKEPDPTPTRLMWIAIAAAVLLLGGLTYRAAREPSASDKPDKPKANPDGDNLDNPSPPETGANGDNPDDNAAPENSPKDEDETPKEQSGPPDPTAT